MQLTNTKVASQQVSFLDAVRIGLGEQQGLFFPTQWPTLDIDALLEMPLVERSSAILHKLIGDELSVADVSDMVSNAFTFVAPLAAVTDDVSCLELFHGPTLAFKDFGGRFMAQALAKRRTIHDRCLFIFRRDAVEEGLHDPERERQMHGRKQEDQAEITVNEADDAHGRPEIFRWQKRSQKA